ncbi:carbohydrate ABC transporter permease [Cellulosilyticum sp. I15G10I2]|uniref:carbohydrate ABC transporter permease n=1 Tax=Cellulosilyticum sp. I15G10I2 TaxID=1892843 RepID=UPI000A463960|nr:sugar ABC transporter permease [Cellulosilyticum sp. I15G10I2]
MNLQAAAKTKTQISPVKRKERLIDNLRSYSLLLPNLILFIAFSVYPVIWTLRYVFYRYGGYGSGVAKFIGMDNIIRVFRDEIYWKSVVNTLVYAGAKILFTIPLAFLLALILSKKRKGNGLLQSVIFVPTIMSAAVMGLVFYLLFNVYNGQINQYLMQWHIIKQPINWLGREHAMKTLVITAVWGGVGNYMVYFIAGIQQVSEDALESARIDGANRLQAVWYIIIPMLGPILKIILMLSITAAFQDMNNVMVLTEGGPTNSTMVMALYGYQYFFSISPTTIITPQYGYGAAVSAVSAVIAGIITVSYLFISKKLDDIY